MDRVTFIGYGLSVPFNIQQRKHVNSFGDFGDLRLREIVKFINICADLSLVK